MKYFCDSVDIVDEMDNIEDTLDMKPKITLTDGHCITGVFECAHVLETNPENVICCILPCNDGKADISIRIQHTLIEAYCWENEIEVVKTDSNDEIKSLLKVSSLDGMDLNCILVCDKDVSSESELDSTDLESDDELYDWPS